MDKARNILKAIGALLPILYCGGLVYYFLNTAGSVGVATEIGLGPTLLGLTGVGLLFCIPLFLKLIKLFNGPRAPSSDGSDGPDNGGGSGFDPDAVIARYLANRPSQATTIAPPAPPTKVGEWTKPSGFGRKTR